MPKIYKTLGLFSIIGYAYLGSVLLLDAHGRTPCIIKNITGVPCPSCGITRSIREILYGNLSLAFWYNPLGFILLLLAIIVPIWILYDIITKKRGFLKYYHKIEAQISKKSIAIPLILLIVIIWIWNINKGL